MTLADRSHYYRGLLLLTRKDNIITDEEKALLLRLGELLQFNRDFCEETIGDLLINPHFDESPPKFSNKSVAKMFLLDGIRIAFADHNLHTAEFKWMQEIARINRINNDWLNQNVVSFLEGHSQSQRFQLENATGHTQLTLPVTA